MRGDLGSFFLSASLSLIFFMASVGISGKIFLILPEGIAALAFLLIIFLNTFSPVYTSGGGGSLENSAHSVVVVGGVLGFCGGVGTNELSVVVVGGVLGFWGAWCRDQ